MSKITGFDIGDPNKPFQVVGSHLGEGTAQLRLSGLARTFAAPKSRD